MTYCGTSTFRKVCAVGPTFIIFIYVAVFTTEFGASGSTPISRMYICPVFIRPQDAFLLADRITYNSLAHWFVGQIISQILNFDDPGYGLFLPKRSIR